MSKSKIVISLVTNYTFVSAYQFGLRQRNKLMKTKLVRRSNYEDSGTEHNALHSIAFKREI
jgi:hypothetical protein